MVTVTSRCKKNLYQVQHSTVKYRFSFRTLSDRNMKMGCHAIFFQQRLKVVPRAYIIQAEHTVSMELKWNMEHGTEHTVSMKLAIRPKICGNFQLKKNFIIQEIRQKSRHFTMLTHGNRYSFQKKYDGSTIILLLKIIKGQTRG